MCKIMGRCCQQGRARLKVKTSLYGGLKQGKILVLGWIVPLLKAVTVIRSGEGEV
jgi:hypothetical protein